MHRKGSCDEICLGARFEVRKPDEHNSRMKQPLPEDEFTEILVRGQ